MHLSLKWYRKSQYFKRQNKTNTSCLHRYIPFSFKNNSGLYSCDSKSLSFKPIPSVLSYRHGSTKETKLAFLDHWIMFKNVYKNDKWPSDIHDE